MNFLSDVKVDRILYDNITKDDLASLELTGRKTSIAKGKNVVVAVIDTGVSPHPEFEDRLLPGYCTHSAYSHKAYQDDHGHGTHVASSVAGKTVGAAPNARILPIKVLDGSGGGSTKAIVDGINYAREWVGPKGEKVNIISMSLGGTAKELGSLTSMKEAIRKCVESNILVVAAAGNSGNECDHYPGSFEDSICVSSTSEAKKQSRFTTFGKQVDVCQVGENIIGAWYKGGYASMSGTSMATPLVSGILADLISDYILKTGEYPIERKSYEALKIHSKDLGIKGVDKVFGVGFACLQPLDINIGLIIGDNNIYVNDEAISTDSPPIMFNNRFYVSLRWIIDFLGGYVKFYSEENKAIFRL